MNCAKCKFYTRPFLVGPPVCTRIGNKGKPPFKVVDAYKICKGYFFEHENELFRFSDDALSDEPFFSDTKTKDEPPTGH